MERQRERERDRETKKREKYFLTCGIRNLYIKKKKKNLLMIKMKKKKNVGKFIYTYPYFFYCMNNLYKYLELCI